MIVTILITLIVCTQITFGVVPLYVAGLLESSDYWWSKYADFLPVLFQSAADEIFNRTDILDGYELKFVYADTKGKEGLAGKVLNEILSTPPVKIAVFGPQMSHELKLVGAITPFYNTIQMNYVAKTSSTKDRSLYSTLYSTTYIEDDLNPLRIALMKYFNWKRVATLVYNDDTFTSQIDEFHQSLVHSVNNLTLITSGIITDKNNVIDHITRLKQYDARIIIGAFRSSIAGQVFCEVYKQGLYGRRYTWILTGASLYENWIKNLHDSDITCTKENLYAATNYMITLNQKPLSSENLTTISGKTPAEYGEWMSDIHSVNGAGSSLTRNHPWIYDAVWALALGLNNSLNYLNGSKLEEFNYTRSDIKDSIIAGMDDVHFEGVSGQVSFRDGRRLGPSFIQLNIGDDRTDVGRFDPILGNITWFVDSSSLWPGNKIPKDGSKTITEIIRSSKAAVIIMGLLASSGFVVAVCFLVFNIRFRANRHIKMSSPRINNMIICGGMIMYISVYVSIMEYVNLVDTDVLCMLGTWTTALGFTTAFGALFSKTWRVHVLFRNNSIKKKVFGIAGLGTGNNKVSGIVTIIKDTQIFAVCAVLLTIDVTVLVPWTLILPLEKKRIVVIIEDEDADITHHEVYNICDSSSKIYWLGVQYVYKGLLLAFGTFLAWETRKIEVPALNDSKLIGFCVYNIVIVCFIGVPIHHLLREDQITMRFVLLNCFIIFCTTLVLCILFVPKLKLRNETENIKFVSSLNGNTSTAVRPSVSKMSKANSSGINKGKCTLDNGETLVQLTVGRDEKCTENGTTKQETERELNGYSNKRPVSAQTVTKETVLQSFADETSTAV